jgi:hypothetical protein
MASFFAADFWVSYCQQDFQVVLAPNSIFGIHEND